MVTSGNAALTACSPSHFYLLKKNNLRVSLKPQRKKKTSTFDLRKSEGESSATPRAET